MYTDINQLKLPMNNYPKNLKPYFSNEKLGQKKEPISKAVIKRAIDIIKENEELMAKFDKHEENTDNRTYAY